MKMNDTFLRNYAKQNIWSSPAQDLQAVIKLHRLTDNLGAKNEYEYNWYQTDLPTRGERYHVYQIGRLHPALVGLIPVRHAWTSCAAQMNVQGMIIDVYTQKGVRLPLFDVFTKVLGNDNMIVAIRDQGRQMTVPQQEIFMRFYSNAYFESVDSQSLPRLPEAAYVPPIVGDWTYLEDIRSDSHPGDILVQGGRLRDRADLQALDVKVTQLRALGFGGVTCYYNGEIVPDFSGFYYNTSRFRIGDWAEFVFDASIVQIQYFPIQELQTFLSTKDQMTKYILMRDIAWDGRVYYKDDFDFYLVKPFGDRFKGRTYYRNTPDAVRMITHQDYSVPVSYVTAYEDVTEGMDDPMSWSIMVVFRRAGYADKVLVNEHARLNELFRLPADKRLRAFRGIDSTVDWWRAAVLEESYLSVLMGERPFTFTTEQVEQTLGYHAVSSIVNQGFFHTTLSADGVTRSIELPVGLQGKATIFEYDQSGVLLGARKTEGTIYYICTYPNCHYVEGRIGHGQSKQGTLFGDGPHQLNPDWDYGFYKKVKSNGQLVGDWIVADPSEYTVDSQNRAWWNISDLEWLLVIRSNHDFLWYEIMVDARDGLSIFSIQSIEEDPSEPFNRVEDLPFGQLDLFLNDKPLIRGLDYTGEWPRFVIANVEHVNPTGLQKISVRAMGLPFNKDGKPVDSVPTEVGFVQFGKLSRNKRYNARTGKVQRFVVRGKVLPKSKLNFSEDVGPLKPSPVVNGDPYSIEEVINPVGNFTVEDTYSMRQRDVERDQTIEDYMGQFFDDTPEPNPNPIPQRYKVVSPFITKILHDMVHGLLVVPRNILPLTQTKLADLLEDYLYLLPYDPGTIGFNWDYTLLIPHAHSDMVEIGVYEYSVLDLANRIYLQGRLDYSNYVRVNPAWTPIPLPPI